MTIDCTGDESVEVSLVKIEDIANRLPNDSYIRIRGEKGNPVFSNMAEVMKINLAHYWNKDEKLLEDEETLTEAEKEEGLESWVPIHLDKANIMGILLERLSSKQISGDVLQLAEGIIHESL